VGVCAIRRPFSLDSLLITIRSAVNAWLWFAFVLLCAVLVAKAPRTLGNVEWGYWPLAIFVVGYALLLLWAAAPGWWREH
jgi:cell division protein FtsX